MAGTFKIVLAVGGIFLAGAVTGGFVSLRVAEHLMRQKHVSEIGGRLAEQLRLTPEQREKIRPILGKTSDELRSLRRDAQSRTASLITQMDADLSRELTEEQRVLLKEIRAKEEERRKKWMAERAAERAKRAEQGKPRPGDEGAPPRPRDLPPPPASTP